MQDFPANSQKAAKATESPKEPIKPVTSAKTGARKRGLGRQFRETFFKGTAKDVRGYLIEDVIVPTIRDTLHEAIQGSFERMIYGGRAGRSGRSSSSHNVPGQFNYNSISTPTRATQNAPQRAVSRGSRARHEFAELIIDNRQDAEEVLDRLFDVLSQYGEVSVAQLYALVDVRPEHTDMKWGWRVDQGGLKGAKAVRLRQGGFLLDLPEPKPLG